MYWDKVAALYDLFETLANRAVYEETGRRVARLAEPDDVVLEVACGTGAISRFVAPVCRHLTATDFSEKMLERARGKLRGFGNVAVEQADITQLAYPPGSFDKAIAGNVIHLLDDPHAAIAGLMRACKPGGRLVIPTYINLSGGRRGPLVKLLERSGAGFKRQFDLASYEAFFKEGGYELVGLDVVEGRMPCAIAVVAC